MLAFLMVFSVHLIVAYSQTICSAYCQPNSCFGTNNNQCTGCDLPFSLSTNQCQIPTSSSSQLVAEKASINISPDIDMICGGPNFKGLYDGNDKVTLTYSGPINIPHYEIKLIVGILFFDDWFDTTFIIEMDTSIQQYFTIGSLTADTQVDVCQLSIQDQYLKLSPSFAHTDRTSSVRFDLQKDLTNVFFEWAIQDYMIVVEKCHIACQVCTDSTNTLCSQCATGYKRSGTICAADCQPFYGQITADPNNCVLCDTKCVECQEVATNCSVCKDSGVYQSFLYGTSCIYSCPDYYYQNIADHQCNSCGDTNNCLQCDVNDPSRCLQCDLDSYWLNFQCYNDCPNGYYNNVRNCSTCDTLCIKCTGYPTPCTQCVAGYYLYNYQCGDCPDGYFGFQPTYQCLDCDLYCTTASLDVYKTSQNQIQCLICFSQPIDFDTFPYKDFQEINFSNMEFSEDRIQISYQINNNKCYTISIKAVQVVQIINLNITISIKPTSLDYYSQNYYKFNPSIYTLTDSQIWNYIYEPSMTDQEIQFIRPLNDANNIINDILSEQWIQQLKKTGLFAYLLPGAQLCSTVLLDDSIVPENYYEAVRFWGIFVFFEVPQWQEDGNNTKYFFSEEIDSILNNKVQGRLLDQIAQVSQNWRFERTGHTNYFILDAYMPLICMGLSLFLHLIAHCLYHKIPKSAQVYMYIALHKIHQVCIFYLILGIIVEWLVTPTYQNQQIKMISLILSIIVILYIFTYYLYVYYSLLGYNRLDPLSYKFGQLMVKYSYFVRDLRYEQYRYNEKWSVRHFFRPYNYQILGFYRLFLVLAALPIFQQQNYGPISCLTFIQMLQITRYFLTWPFHSLWRNIYKLVLEFILLLIFIIYFITAIMRQQIYQNLNTIDLSYIDQYYNIGWIGFYAFNAYNLLFIVYTIIGLIFCVFYSNKNRVFSSRQQYYHNKIKQLNNLKKKDKQQQKCSYIKCLQRFHGVQPPQMYDLLQNRQKMIKNMINKGNLLNRDPFSHKRLRVIIEEIQVKVHTQRKYSIDYYKVKDIYMKNKTHESDTVKITTHLKQINNIIISLTQDDNNEHEQCNKFFNTIDQIYNKYATFTTQSIKIVIYTIIDQNQYRTGTFVPMQQLQYHQQIHVLALDAHIDKFKLQNVMDKFPVSKQLINIYQDKINS